MLQATMEANIRALLSSKGRAGSSYPGMGGYRLFFVLEANTCFHN
jgi:hypothetical protein